MRIKPYLLIAALLLAAPLTMAAQGGRGGTAPPAAREAAPIDLTGYWVSVIVEDWKWRMVTPRKGIIEGVPLNAEGRKVAESWDPARDAANGEQCRAYTAAGIMRLPRRLHVSWENASTLRVDTDAGTQTRRFHFAAAPAPGKPSWQGHSVARWEYAPRGEDGSRLGNLKVTTTNLRSGYVRRNGVPHSARAVVTEYWDVHALPNGDQWLTVTTKVEDPQYFLRHYITTSDFKKLPDASGWSPTPCAAS